MSRLGGHAGRVAQALAVLGPGWVAEPGLAALAAVPDMVAALQELVAAGLAETRAVDAGTVRFTHALLRSSRTLSAGIGTATVIGWAGKGSPAAARSTNGTGAMTKRHTSITIRRA